MSIISVYLLQDICINIVNRKQTAFNSRESEIFCCNFYINKKVSIHRASPFSKTKRLNSKFIVQNQIMFCI